MLASVAARTGIRIRLLWSRDRREISGERSDRGIEADGEGGDGSGGVMDIARPRRQVAASSSERQAESRRPAGHGPSPFRRARAASAAGLSPSPSDDDVGYAGERTSERSLGEKMVD